MVTLKTPEAPATSKQLWLLHLLTKTDTRNLNITMQEASNRIEQLKANGNHKPSHLTTTGKPQGDTARADYRVSGARPLVNPHASYIQQDKQKLAQARYDKAHPQPEREVIQGTMPQGETDMAKIEVSFKANCYEQGRAKAENDTAKIGFYDFQCQDCLFGKTGICEPSWREASFTTGGGITQPLRVESVSFDCNNHEPVKYSISEYCHRPHGKQCHRKHVDNKCLECNYRKRLFRDGYNHSANASYIPTIPERIKREEYWLNQFKESSNQSGIEQANRILALLNKLA